MFLSRTWVYAIQHGRMFKVSTDSPVGNSLPQIVDNSRGHRAWRGVAGWLAGVAGWLAGSSHLIGWLIAWLMAWLAIAWLISSHDRPFLRSYRTAR